MTRRAVFHSFSLSLLLLLSGQAARPASLKPASLKAALPSPKAAPRVSLPLPAPTPAASPTPAPAPRGLPTLTPRVLARYPHDPGAFTEGLQLVGNVLYESTGLVGESSLRRINLATGEILQRRSPPSSKVFSEGLAVLGGVAYQLTWQSGLVYLYDPQTLQSLGQLRYQGEGWGLTHDGKQLIMSDGSDTLFWRDPTSFAVTRKVKVTAGGAGVANLNELEYVGGTLYANIWLSNKIAQIDPLSGKVTAWLDVTALAREAQAAAEKAGRELSFDDVPNGIAYNAAKGTLLLTGKRWPLIFEVKLP